MRIIWRSVKKYISILSILVLAEQMWIDINEALKMKLKKIENRGGV